MLAIAGGIILAVFIISIGLPLLAFAVGFLYGALIAP